MPVDTKHRLYQDKVLQWQRCRDCFNGADAVKARGVTYLPQLSGVEASTYTAYVTRAMFYNAYARTVAGLAGILFRKPPTLEAPAPLQSRELADVTMNGVPWNAFAMECAEEQIKVGRLGVLVDYHNADAPATDFPLPVASIIKGQESRAYAVLYRAEQIISWLVAQIGGEQILLRVILEESIDDPDPKDPFATKLLKQYRVCELDDQALYRVRVYRLKEGQSGVKAEDWDIRESIPRRRAERLDRVPFEFINASSQLASPEKPPLVDLADVNIAHYRNSADLEWGRHFTALPTPWVTGWESKGQVLVMGPTKAWTFEDANAKVGMLEFTGSGLGSLQKGLEEKQAQMAVLGARLLEEPKAAAEAVGTIAMRHAGDDAVLRVMGDTLSAGLSNVLYWLGYWTGLADDAKSYTYKFLTDFVSVTASPLQIQTWMAAWQAGGMSFETFYENLRRGGQTREGITHEQERQQIAREQGDDFGREPPPAPEPGT